MEKTYTEQEIQEWFASMMEKYQNCPMGEHLMSVYYEMFNPFGGNNLQTFVEKGLTNKSTCAILKVSQEERKGRK